MGDQELDTLTRHVVGLAALTVAGDRVGLAAEAQQAADQGVQRQQLEEAILLASLFAGFPRGLVAFQALSQALGPVDVEHHAEQGQESVATGDAERRRLGESVFRTIHGPTADAQLKMLEAQPGVFVQQLLGEAYGRIIARDVLSLKLRELVAMACLCVLELPVVLKAHALAAKRHGAAPTELKATVECACRLVNKPSELLLKSLPG